MLRTARFAARYHHLGFSIASETMDAMRVLVDSGEMEHLVAERVWRETQRALGEQTPQVYFQTLRDCGALACILPEVDRLFGVAQRPDFHPEIDTGVHTMMALEQAAKLSDDCSVRFAVLVHDVGKGITPADVLPRHTGHEARGLPLVKTLCERLKVPNEYRKLALVVTEYHLQCHRAADLKVETLLNLLRGVGALKSSAKLEPFLLSCEADARGRLGLETVSYTHLTLPTIYSV